MHETGAEMATAIMVQGAAFAQRHTDHGLLGSSRCLLDCFRHFACLAMTMTDPALAIAHDDKRCKAEALAALHCLGDAVDVNELFDQLFTALFGVLATAIVTTPAIAITATARATFATATTTAATRTAAFRGCRFYAAATSAPWFSVSSAIYQNSNPPSRAASASAFTRPWIEEASAIEHNLGNTGLLGTFGNHLADSCCRIRGGAGLVARILFKGRSCEASVFPASSSMTCA
jgi:hypothetical protein